MGQLGKRDLVLLGLVVILGSASSLATPKSAYVWSELQSGLHYATFSFDSGETARTTIHAFAIDPHLFRIDLAVADKNEAGNTIATLARQSGAILAINGGFFADDHRSIGLLVRSGEIINKQHGTSWWGIFSIEAEGPTIHQPHDYHPLPTTKMAIQAGPRLVVNGVVSPKLKEEHDARSAIGITRSGDVLFVVTEGAGLTLGEFAERLVLPRWQGGLECDNALNLDGGGSTQLFAHVGKFSLDVLGLARIANGIVVIPKETY